MIKRCTIFLLLTCVALCPTLLLAAAPITTDPEAFRKGHEGSERHNKERALQEYRRGPFYSVMGPLMNGATNECYASVPGASKEPFSFVITMNKRGEIIQIALNKVTNVSQCMTRRFSTIHLPPPPFEPFSEQVDLKFK